MLSATLPILRTILIEGDTFMEENNNIILSVKDLNVKFNLRGKVLHAIRGVSLDVYKGESLALVGESGCEVR